MLYIFSDSNESFFISDSIDAQRLSLKHLSSHSQRNDDITYIDVSTLSKTRRKKVIEQVKQCCNYGYYGIMDPNNDVADPASLFFDGMHDYVGGQFCKEPITKKRLKNIETFAHSSPHIVETAEVEKQKQHNYRQFSGWNTIKTGQIYQFCFLFVSIEKAADMKSRLGNSVYKECIARFNYALHHYFSESAPHLWIETDAGILYLLPPFSEHIEAGVEGALRMLLSAPLITYEKMRLPFLSNFVFALHIGSTEYAPRGYTGEIVSEAINFIYHLGYRKADAGRITVSEEVYALIKNEKLKNFFIPNGTFETHKLFHSRRFSFNKNRKRITDLVLKT